MRRAQTFVSMLQRHGQARGILHAVAAPGRTDAGFDGTQRFPVGVPGLKSGFDHRLPDLRQLLQRCAKQVDALTAGNFTVQLIALGDLPDGDQPVSADFTGRHARNNRIRAVFLNIGKIAVVGVLERQMRRFEQIFIPARRQNRPNQRFADFAAMPLPVAGNQLFKGVDAIDAHQVVNFLTRVSEVFADILFHLHALRRQLELHHLFHQRATPAAAGGSFGALFNRADVRRPGAHRLADITFTDVMTGADLRAVRQCGDAKHFGRTPRNGG
ncbi:hypothetical protein D3C80_911040 [compost metagenome]